MSLTCFGHLGSLFSLAYPSIDVTGALVPHLPKCMVFGLGFSVLVCLSVDVTGALVLLIRFFGSAPSCFVLAPPPYFLFQFALHLHFGSAHYALHNFGLCCPLSLWWSCGSLDLLPCGARGISLCLAPVCASPGLPGSLALLAVRVLALLVLWFLPSFVFGSFLCPFCFPFPRGLSGLVPWSSALLGLLVPPSGYLVAAVTA